MNCQNCKAKLNKDSIYCPECGTKVISDMESKKPEKSIDSTVDNSSIDNSKRKTSKSRYTILISSALCLIVIISILMTNNNRSEKNIAKSVEKEVTTKEDKIPNNEYIFPKSDIEYLSDNEIENFSTDELALARNEIIARHGRIFTDEKYKSYFESKNWYEGTVEPEVFDASYEKELNDIEKANIELIKKYENMLNGDAENYYSPILSEYQQIEQNNFVGDTSQYPNVNQGLFNQDEGTLYYTVIDLCNDGIPELFISQRLDDKSSNNIVDIYGYTDGNAQHLSIGIGLSTKPLDENKTMGNSTSYTICDNSMIKEITSNDTNLNTIEFYQLGENSINLQQIEGVGQDGDNYYRHFSGGLEAEEISLQQYNEFAEQYSEKEDIIWCKVSNFKCGTNKTVKSDSLYTLAKEYYGDFLQYYKEEEQNGFNIKDLELINPIFSDPGYFPNGYAQSGIELYYTVIDLANDGIPELFISDGDTLYGAYGVYESEGQICPLIYTNTAYIGDREKYFICENNMIKSEGSGGASSNIIAYYQVAPHSQNATCIEAIYQENSNYYWGNLKGNNFEQTSSATGSEYEDMKNKYPLKKDIEWLKLSEL